MSFSIRRAIASTIFLLGLLVSAYATDTVTVIATNPTANEQGLSPGQVTFYRTGSQNALTVSYTISGTGTSDLSGGYISSLILQSPGSGYYSPFFNIVLAGGATGTAYSTGGTLTGIAFNPLTQGGSGYTSLPNVTITSTNGAGSGATAIVTLSQTGGVVSITLTNPGTGYSATAGAPTIVFTDPPGAGGGGAAATCTISGGTVQTITITNPGTGYSLTNPPTVTFNGGNPTTAATGTVNVGLSVTGIYVQSGGTGYLSPPTVTIGGPQLTGGTGATAGLATITGSPISSVQLNSPGNGYVAPTVTIADSGGAHGSAAIAVVENTGISAVAISNGGSGFAMPILTISGGGGTGATGEVVVNGGVITQVRLLTPGSGFTSAPTISIAGGGGSGAAVFPTVVNGQIASLTLGAGGSGYTSPTVTISSTPVPTTPAVVTATTDEGVITALTLVSSGAGYGGPSQLSIPDPANPPGLVEATVVGVENGADYVHPANSSLVAPGGTELTGTVYFPPGQQQVTLDIDPLRNGVGGGRTLDIQISPQPGSYIAGAQSGASIVIADADVAANLQVLQQDAYPTLPNILSEYYALEVQGAAEWMVQFRDDSGNLQANPFRSLSLSITGDPSVGPQAAQGQTYTLVQSPETINAMLTDPFDVATVVPYAPGNPPPAVIPPAPKPGDSSVIVNTTDPFSPGDMIMFQSLALTSEAAVNGVYDITAIDRVSKVITFTPPLSVYGDTVYGQTLVRRVGTIVPVSGLGTTTTYGVMDTQCYYAVPIRNLNLPPRGQNSIQLTIVQSSDYRTLSPTSGTCILADDAVTTGLQFGNNAGKPNTPGVALVDFNKPFTIPVNVPFLIESTSTAVFGTDYTITGVDPSTMTGSVQVRAGDTSAVITVTPLTATGAAIVGTEVDLRLLPSENYLLTPAGTSPVNPTATINVAPVPVTSLGEPVFVSVSATSGDAGPTPANPSGPTNGDFRLRLTDLNGNPLLGTVSQDLTVSYAIGGNASPGLDYVSLTPQAIPPTGTAVIKAGTSYVDVPLVVVSNNTVGGNKSVIMTVDSNTGYQVSLLSNATATINDYGPMIAIVETSPATVNGVAGVFTITNADAITTPITVHYSATGTALAGTDYQTLSGVVQIPAGVYPNPVTVTIPVFAALSGLGKTITVSLQPDPLSPPTYGLTALSSASMTVVPAAGIVATAPAIINSTTPGVFTVTLSAASNNAETIGYTATGTAVAGTDYTALSGAVVVPAGATSASILVNGAAASAAGKLLTVQLLGDTNTPPGYGLAVISSATMTFSNAVSVAATSRAQGPGGSAVFTVTEPIVQVTDTTISYTIGGTAVGGTDYLPALSGSVLIPAGATSAAITVGNVQASGAGKTVTVTLEASTATPPAYILSSAVTATTTLFNTVTIAETTAATSTVNGVFTVSMSGPAPTNTTIQVGIGGSAVAGMDYAAIPGTVVIFAGSTSAAIPVTNADSGGHTLIVTLLADPNAPASYFVGAPASATMILGVDNAPPVITSAATATGTVGTSFSYQITAANVPSSFTATNLPPGLTLNPATGLISGNPVLAGGSTVGLTATNAFGTGNFSLLITIAGASSIAADGSAAVPAASDGGNKGGSCGLGGGALGLMLGLLALRRRRST